MLTFSATKTREDGRTKTESYYLPSPYLCFQKMCQLPSAGVFKCASRCCSLNAGLAVIGGVVSIALIESSGQSNGMKTAGCIAGGLLILSSYYCYKLGSGYAAVSDLVRESYGDSLV